VTAAVLDRPCAPSAGSARGVDHGPVTLRELLDTTLHAACANGRAECPACHGCMTYTRAGAECGACGSRLT
jgi:hypothetical protein